MNNAGHLISRAKSITTALTIFVIISMALDALSALATMAFGPADPNTLTPGGAIEGLLALIYLPIIITSGVLYFMWLNRSVKATSALVETKFPYTPNYAVGCHFIPVINLVRPFYVVRELFTRTLPQGEKLSSNLNMKLQVWWNCWVLAGLVSYAQFASKMPSLELVSSILFIAAGFALMSLVKELPLLQERKFEEFLAKQSAPAEGFVEYPRSAVGAAD